MKIIPPLETMACDISDTGDERLDPTGVGGGGAPEG